MKQLLCSNSSNKYILVGSKNGTSEYLSVLIEIIAVFWIDQALNHGLALFILQI